MASQRELVRMSDEEVEEFVRTSDRLHAATLNRDGSVHLTTLTFGVVGGKITFWAYRSSQKILNLRRDPRITVLVEGGDIYEELRGVSIQGVATIVDDSSAVLRLAKEIFAGHGRLTEVMDARINRQSPKRVAVVVEPSRVVSWDHTKLDSAER